MLDVYTAPEARGKGLATSSLRATFKYLLPAGAVNPFYNMVTKETDTVFRKPFSPEELSALLAKTRLIALSGRLETYKTTVMQDATAHNPQWMS